MNQLSRIISGTMTWGAWGKCFSTDQMQSLIEHATSLGITTFDHADIYGGYTTEAEFGKAFAHASVDRSSVQFVTKCGIQYPCEERPLTVKHYNTTSEHIRQSVEASLRHLQTEYLDVLLIHRPSPLMDPHEMGDIVAMLKDEGKIHNFGVSNFTPSQLALLQTQVDLDWNQLECSLTHDAPMTDGTLDMMVATGIGAMAWSPLGNVFKESGEVQARIRKALEPLCDKYRATEDQLLLTWIMKHPAQITPVVGTTSEERLELATKATQIEISLPDWFIMLEAAKGHRVA
ncbi:MAG TPA: aldo/keto reductase [Bacteroidetes bacterium]|nr:aldo/keto reductase [Bacteroidota bacterium]